MKKLVIGCGYLGSRVASAWLSAGHEVWVATRSSERAKKFGADGFRTLVLDVALPETLEMLPDVDTLLFAVGYDRSAGVDQRRVYVDGLVHVLDRLPDVRDRLIYISSTGVYAQGDDGWVNEQSACEPIREGGRCCWAAEERLRRHRWGDRSVILRLAGIYGPGRVPYLDRLRRNEPLPVETSGYLNLIHVDDAVRVVLAAERGPVPELFVVSDGHPVKRDEYYREVGRRLGIEPRFVSPEPGSAQAARAAASKRIDSRHLRQTLPVEIRFPDYRAGLAAILGDASA